MKRKGLVTLIALGATYLATPIAAQETSQEVGPNDDLQQKLREDFQKFLEYATEYKKSQSTILTEDAVKHQGNIFGNLKVSDKENILVSKECQARALRHGVETARAHMGLDFPGALDWSNIHTGQQHDILYSGQVTLFDYVKHIAECKGFCGPVVEKLIICHVEVVAKLQHALVFFEKNQDEVSASNWSWEINHFADTLKADPELNILLIGRASRTGPPNYNFYLSVARARNVERAFVGLGIARQRIKWIAFGWEPPQITSKIAERYQISEIYERLGKERINQSVMMILY